jgi:hypothetical protein
MKTIKIRIFAKYESGVVDKIGDYSIIDVINRNFELPNSPCLIITTLFTYAYDENGKEIYEGDILKLERDGVWYEEELPPLIEVVVYDENKTQFNVGNLIDVQPNSNWEIIGNKYQNPELCIAS